MVKHFVFLLFALLVPNVFAVDIFVSTIQDNQVWRIDSSGNTYSFVSQGLSRPKSLAFGLNNSLYIGNAGNNTISKVDSFGNVSTFASFGLDGPEGLAYDFNTSTLFVSNTNNNTLSKIDSYGNTSLFVSSGLAYPRGLAIGPDGFLYVANFGNSTISKIDSNGITRTIISLPAGSNPWGLAFDSIGNLYSSNLGSLNINKITPSGVISSFGYGSYGIAFAGETNDVYVAISRNILANFNTISGNGSYLNSNLAEPIGVAINPFSVPEPNSMILYLITIIITALCQFLFRKKKLC